MWGGSGYGGGGLTGLGASTATSSQSHPGGMMGGMWGMMGNNGLATDGRNIMMGCFQYMAHYPWLRGERDGELKRNDKCVDHRLPIRSSLSEGWLQNAETRTMGIPLEPLHS